MRAGTVDPTVEQGVDVGREEWYETVASRPAPAVFEYVVPVDPMDELHCESCQ